LSAPDDLISFPKAIPVGRYRLGLRYQQWLLLLVVVLATLSTRVNPKPKAPSSTMAEV